MRNPVINMAIMWATSDIPDWCFVEAGMTYDPATPPNTEQVGMLLSKSPIAHINKVLHMYRVYMYMHVRCLHIRTLYGLYDTCVDMYSVWCTCMLYMYMHACTLSGLIMEGIRGGFPVNH